MDPPTAPTPDSPSSLPPGVSRVEGITNSLRKTTMSLKRSFRFKKSDDSRMSFEHRSVVRLFSNSSTTSNGSRKTSVPSAVLASAPLMSAAIGDGLGTQLCEFLTVLLAQGDQVEHWERELQILC
ncbi:hypothetical protein L5515_016413 [Caenorhabditis briggsae]|uniref:Uncharacterized protein n=1 Tax=Caenorhabditis briggsae TaxID=6238 RepID=A0AAE9F6J0_CAEBR|nr:hypothetical protein L3Y34_010530 [Caenorhabditis briggsae]UMM39296.1 hypothetical protein L5515_016413 [Caenorhabditis briggsae]